MDYKLGVWIDHTKAVIVSATEDRVTVKTLHSEPEPRPGDADQVAFSTAHATQERDSDKPFAQCDAERLDRYYDEVINRLGHPAALLIFGPGEAKLQLKARLIGSNALPEPIVGIETTDTMTDSQIVAKVKDHYGIARRDDAAGPRHRWKPH